MASAKVAPTVLQYIIAASALMMTGGCVLPLGAVHCRNVGQVPSAGAVKSFRYVLTRPMAVGVIGQPKRSSGEQEYVLAFDSRSAADKTRQPLPTTLPAGTTFEFTRFSESQSFALTVWPLWLNLFPGKSYYDATLVTPDTPWGSPHSMSDGVEFNYDCRQLRNTHNAPWESAAAWRLRSP